MATEFWLVWNERRDIPTYKHLSAEAAKLEAHRLARQSPGDEFHVLCLIGTVKRVDVEWIEPTPDNLPF